mmetsp:Transcript_3850/g.12018  ORF Transcript_3850/g.12018 Transcript_3850/m.12018 type:complete len:218 (-) Transcript_3850:551-1204(-)
MPWLMACAGCNASCTWTASACWTRGRLHHTQTASASPSCRSARGSRTIPRWPVPGCWHNPRRTAGVTHSPRWAASRTGAAGRSSTANLRTPRGASSPAPAATARLGCARACAARARVWARRASRTRASTTCACATSGRSSMSSPAAQPRTLSTVPHRMLPCPSPQWRNDRPRTCCWRCTSPGARRCSPQATSLASAVAGRPWRPPQPASRWTSRGRT